MGAIPQITAWRPDVAGIAEVFHARFTDHAYPMHTHDAWTLLIVDEGEVSYQLDGHEHGSAHDFVTLLPPHVPHNGRSVHETGFRKRVLYFDASLVDGAGNAVDRPALRDPLLRLRVHQLHGALGTPGDRLEAESRFALVVDRLQDHLRRQVGSPVARRDPRLARALRELLDTRVGSGITLADAGARLHADPTHLVRTFTREFGLPPHRYLTGRRIDAARKLLLAGQPAAEVATAVGFHDQAHLNRHFKQVIGTTPGRFARGRAD